METENIQRDSDIDKKKKSRSGHFAKVLAAGLTACLSSAVLTPMMGTTAMAEVTDTAEPIEATSWSGDDEHSVKNIIKNAGSNVVIKISNDLVADETLSVTAGKNVKIISDGKTVYREDGAVFNSMFSVEGGNLTLGDGITFTGDVKKYEEGNPGQSCTVTASIGKWNGSNRLNDSGNNFNKSKFVLIQNNGQGNIIAAQKDSGDLTEISKPENMNEFVVTDEFKNAIWTAERISDTSYGEESNEAVYVFRNEATGRTIVRNPAANESDNTSSVSAWTDDEIAGYDFSSKTSYKTDVSKFITADRGWVFFLYKGNNETDTKEEKWARKWQLRDGAFSPVTAAAHVGTDARGKEIVWLYNYYNEKSTMPDNSSQTCDETPATEGNYSDPMYHIYRADELSSNTGFFVNVSDGNLNIAGATLKDFTSNADVTNVAPVYAKGGNVTMTSGSIENNTVGYTADDSKSDMGNKSGKGNSENDIVNYVNNLTRTKTAGGIYFTDGATGNITGGTIKNNKADTGAIYVTGEGTNVTLSDNGKLENNVGLHWSGAATVDNGGYFLMTGGEINNNVAWRKGGAVWVTQYGPATNGDPKYNWNTHAKEGGDPLKEGRFRMEGGTIDGNTAFVRAGAIEVESNQVELIAGNVTNNTCRVLGGAVYVEGDHDGIYSYTLVLEKGNITDNHAVSPEDTHNAAYKERLYGTIDTSDEDAKPLSGAITTNNTDDAHDHSLWNLNTTGTGGAIWTCSRGTNQVALGDNSSVIIANNTATGNQFTGTRADSSYTGAHDAASEATRKGGQDYHNVGNNSGLILLGELASTWKNEVEGQGLPEKNSTYNGYLSLKNETGERVNGGMNFSGNVSRRGGAIAANGSLLIGNTENVDKVNSELTFKKDWTEGTEKEAVNIRVSLINEDSNVIAKDAVLGTVTLDGKADEGGNNPAPWESAEWTGSVKLPTKVIDTNNNEHALFKVKSGNEVIDPTEVSPAGANPKVGGARIYELAEQNAAFEFVSNGWKVLLEEVDESGNVSDKYTVDVTDIEFDGYTAQKDSEATYRGADNVPHTILTTVTTLKLKQGITNTKKVEETPEKPQVEKYINDKVHQTLANFDEEFEYEIMAYVPKGATEITVSDTLEPSLDFVYTDTAETKVVNSIVAFAENDHKGDETGTVKNNSGIRTFGAVVDGTRNKDDYSVNVDKNNRTVSVTLKDGILNTAEDAVFKNQAKDLDGFWLKVSFKAKYNKDYHDLNKVKTDASWMNEADKAGTTDLELDYVKANAEVRRNNKNIIILIDGKYFRTNYESDGYGKTWEDVTKDASFYEQHWAGDDTLEEIDSSVIEAVEGVKGYNGSVINAQNPHEGTKNQATYTVKIGNNPDSEYKTNIVTVEPKEEETEDSHGKVIVSKFDNETKTLLKDAKLQILSADGTKVVYPEGATKDGKEEKDYFLSKEETITIGLPVGTYKLHEVEAPEGYEKAEDVEFTVEEIKETKTVTTSLPSGQVNINGTDDYGTLIWINTESGEVPAYCLQLSKDTPGNVSAAYTEADASVVSQIDGRRALYTGDELKAAVTRVIYAGYASYGSDAVKNLTAREAQAATAMAVNYFTDYNSASNGISYHYDFERGNLGPQNVMNAAKALVEIGKNAGYTVPDTFEVKYFAPQYNNYQLVVVGGNKGETVSVEGEAAKVDMYDDKTVIKQKPEIGTTATANSTNDHITFADKKVTVKDVVSYTNLDTDKEYTLTGKLVRKSNGTDVEGATASKKFKPAQANGEETLEFTFDASGLEGDSVVAYEYVTYVYTDDQGNEVTDDVAKHEDINDGGQTVVIPKAETNASDAEGNKTVKPEENVTIKDIVTYSNLIPGKEYTVEGTLHIQNENGTDGGELADNGAKASKTFTADSANGEVTLEFNINASSLAGKKVVAFETVKYNGVIVAVHADITDESQTVEIEEPEEYDVKINKTDMGGNEVEGAEIKVTGKDFVQTWTSKKNETMNIKVPEGEYTLVEVNEPEGYQKVTTEIKFRVDKDGKVTVTTTKVEPAGACEVINGVLVLKDELNPEIRTTATDNTDGDKEVTAESKAQVKDVVKYSKLIAGKTYTMEGQLVKKSDKSVVATATKEFVAAEGGAGEVELVFEFDASELAGQSAVAFETAKEGDEVIATHADLEDEDQTVEIVKPEIGTTATDKADNDKTLKAETVEVKDVVEYKNLTVGKTYTLTGKLVTKSSNGETVVSENSTTFKPEATSGTVELVFSVDASTLKGEELVAFETVTFDNKEVAVHADITDAAQTVEVETDKPVIRTTATDNADGDKKVAAEDKAQVKDVVKYQNLEAGKTYTMEGKLVKKSDQSVIATASTEFKAADSGKGEVTLVFEFDASAIAGEQAVAFETAKDGETEVAVHANINDKSQTVDIVKPEVKTTAEDAADQDKNLEAAETVKVKDIVEYKNLTKGKEYTLSGKLVTKSSNGEKVAATAEKKFKPESANGTVELEFTVKTTDLKGEKLVVFETVTYNNNEVAVHADINDADQTVEVEKPGEKPVKISKTTLGGDEIEGATIVLTNDKGEEVETWVSTTVAHELSLTPGTYTFKETVAPEGFKAVTTEITFEVDEDGNVTLEGATVDNGAEIEVLDVNHIVLKDAPEKGPEIEKYVNKAVHSDITLDEVFTYDVLAYITKDADKATITDDLVEDLQFVSKAADVKVVDLGETVDHAPNGSVAAAGTKVANAKATINGRNLTVAIEDAKALRGHWVRVTFEAKITDGKKVADLKTAEIKENAPVLEDKEHEGVPNIAKYTITVGNEGKYSDESNTVTVTPEEPKVETNATDAKDGDKELEAGESVQIKDIVKYTGLTVGKTYTVTGTLHDKADGSEIAATVEPVTFKATTKDGELEMIFTVDARELAGKEVVVFETVTSEGREIAVHADLNDENQTVTVDKPGTVKVSKTDLGGKEIKGAKILVTDGQGNKVEEWTSTNRAKQLELKEGSYVLKETVAPAGYQQITTAIEFDVDAKGNVTLKTATVDGNGKVEVMSGDKIVLKDAPEPGTPEIEKYVNKVVHSDITLDEVFTYDVLAYITKDADKATITDDLVEDLQFVSKEADVKVVDLGETVDHTPNGSVAAAGTKVANAKATINGRNLTVAIDDAKALRGHWVKVTFDAKIADGKKVADLKTAEIKENTPVLSDDEHAGVPNTAKYTITVGNEGKYSDESNTVTVTPEEPKVETNASDAKDGDKELEAGESVQIKDIVKYTGLTVGKTYTVTGTLHDKADGSEIAATVEPVTFTAETKDGELEMIFTVDARELTGKEVVVFETVTSEGREIAVHADLNDENQTVTVDKPGTVKVSKTDLGGKEIKGAKILVTDAQGNKVEEWTSSNRAKQLELKEGSYVLKETVAPAGYQQITTAIEFDVDAKGNVTLKTATVDGNGKVEVMSGDKIVLKDAPEPGTPEIEKYVNKAVHSDITLDEVFTYDVLAYITKDADKATITDDLVEDLQFVSVAADVKVEDLGETVDHTPNGSVAAAGTKVENAKATINGRNLTVAIDDAKALRGHWVKVTFEAKIADGKKVADLKTAEIKENAPVLADEEHEGVPNTAKYTITVGNEGKYSDESNTVTVTPEEPKVETNAADAKDGDKELEAGASVQIKDIVKYTGLTVGKTYTVTGTLHDKVDGSEIAATVEPVTFTAETKDGELEMIFTVDARALAGKEVVVFETVTSEGREIAVHADLNDENQTVEVEKPDEDLKAIEISKLDINGAELPGAKIEIIDSKANVVESWTSVTEPKKLKLAPGEYTFHEVFAPEGYKVVNDIKFTVNKDATITVTDANGEKVTAQSGVVKVADPAEDQTIKISKCDLDGTEVPGATIKVTGEDFEETWVSTNETHELTLQPGKYTLVEEVAPEGFKKVTTTIEFTVDTEGKVEVLTQAVENGKVAVKEDGTLVLFDEPDETPAIEKYVNKNVHKDIALDEVFTYDVLAYITKDADTVTIKDELVADLQIVSVAADVAVADLGTQEPDHTPNGSVAKEGAVVTGAMATVDGNNLTVQIADAKALRGHWVKVTFDAKIADGKTIEDLAQVTIDKNDPVITDEKHEGVPNKASYEIGVKSLVLDENGHPTFDENGNVVKEDEATKKYEEESNTVTVKPEEDETVEIKISKVDIVGNEIEGAEIQIKQGDTVVESWTSTTEVHELTLKPGEYVFHEEAAPNGYVAVTDITFTVDEAGKITVTDTKADYAEVDENGVLVITDEYAPHDVNISKADLDGVEVPGAKIKVTGENFEEEWTSTTESHTLTLKPGKYTLVEEVAPEGFKKVTTTIEFTVDTEGKVEVLTQAVENGKVAVREDGTLVLFDEPLPEEEFEVKISKNSLGGSEIPGAAITVTGDGVNETWISTDKPHELTLASGRYTMKEVVSPAGYQPVTTEMVFNVDGEGKVTLETVEVDGAGAIRVDGTNHIVLEDAPNPTIAISKSSLGGTEIPGAVISLTGENGFKDTWTSTTESHELTLAPGRYTMVEVVSPEGYQQVTTEMVFVVDEYGNVTLETTEVDGGGRLTTEKGHINLEDAPIAPTGVVLEAEKILEGGELTEGQFSFVLSGEGVEQTKVNTADGKVTFDEIEYTFADIGKHIYTISEVTTDDKDIIYDTSVKSVIVDVKKVSVGEGAARADVLEATVDYGTAGKASFVNKVVQPGVTYANIVVNKSFKVNGVDRTPEAGEFEFVLGRNLERTENENGDAASSHIALTASNDAVGKVDFGTISYTEPGTYSYSISEINNGETGVTFDTNTYYVDVVVTEGEPVTSEDGTVTRPLVAEVIYPEGGVTFVNEKEEKLPVVISKTDIATGNELPGATLIVTDAQGNEVDRWVSTNEVHTVELLPGSYTLTEVSAPAGYNIAESIVFTVDANGLVGGDKVVMQDSADRIHEIVNLGLSLEKKWTDYEGNEVSWPAGMTTEFTLQYFNRSANAWTDYIVNGAPYKVTLTEASPIAIFEEMPSELDGVTAQYRAVETKIDGYTQAVSTVTDIANRNTAMTAVNVPETPDSYEVFISKNSLGGSEIAGAHIVVYDATGNVVDEWTSTTEAHQLSLKAGTYTMVETVAPEGYQKVETAITFMVNADGHVTLGTTTVDNGGKISVMSGNHVILEDAPVEKRNPNEPPTTDEKKTEVIPNSNPEKNEDKPEIPTVPSQEVTRNNTKVPGVPATTRRTVNTPAASTQVTKATSTGDTDDTLMWIVMAAAAAAAIAALGVVITRRRRED